MPDFKGIEDPYEFEKHVARQCEELGYEVIMPPANQPGYDIEIKKGRERIAVQVKCYKARCPISALNKFIDFLELPIASGFTSGWLVTQITKIPLLFINSIALATLGKRSNWSSLFR